MASFRFLAAGCSSLTLTTTLLGFVWLTPACDADTGSNTTTKCSLGALRCSCYANDTCNGALVCRSGLCVDDSPDAQGGASNPGAGGTGNSSQGGAALGNGGSNNPTGEGGANTGQGGAVVGNGGAVVGNGGAVVGNGGAVVGNGGAVVGNGGAVVGNGGAIVGAGGSVTVSPNLIESFATCDSYIDEVSGRSGKWYNFADTGITIAKWGVGDPGATWSDHSCSVYFTGGCALSSSYCNYAGIGVQLASGDAYSLSSYSGIRTTFESEYDIYFTIKTCSPATCTGASGFGYHGAWLTGSLAGPVTRSISFMSLLPTDANRGGSYPDLQNVLDIQYTAGSFASGFGYAIHRIELY